ncbi:hypothetical protein P4H71_28340 [Paenibacillus kribbensis]|uniref:hypothetical protein n=1 Tax=Paenibacillus kribbensis TaxID=172713 RepID=UPI002DBBFDE1|nr:hypothetical protein [Paenibacillus kribbensis]MEC0238228.1 hypothetical protein [Paenibacillus kribbensis]
MEPNKRIQGGISQFFSYPDAKLAVQIELRPDPQRDQDIDVLVKGNGNLDWTELKMRAAARLIQSAYDQACDHPDGQAHFQALIPLLEHLGALIRPHAPPSEASDLELLKKFIKTHV